MTKDLPPWIITSLRRIDLTVPMKINPFSWKRRFDEEAPLKSSPMKINLKMLAEMLPMIFRVMRRLHEDKKRGRQSPMNMFTGSMISHDMGVPLGGLGGGSLVRGFRGDFNRWQMQPGMVHYGAVAADQFCLWAQRPGQPAQALVLNPGSPQDGSLSAWNWGMPASIGTYHALFPRAWTTYEQPVAGLRLTCRQISPVIPHNYQESSLPAGIFIWEIENSGDTEVDMALMFTFQNGTGTANDLAGGHANHLVKLPAPGGEIVSLELQHIHRQPKPLAPGQKLKQQSIFEDPLSFAIATQDLPGLEISYTTRFLSNASGKELWEDFCTDGRLENSENEEPASKGQSIAAALAVRLQIPAGEIRQVVFGLAWDMPVARFGCGTGWYRRYTRFYGRDGRAAARIARDAILNHPAWEQQIGAWQEPVLSEPGLPDWYKAMLFNETYYLVDGGTIWTDGREGDGSSPERESLPEPGIGHFAYLESHEYLYYNTYDVHFSASFALAMLWPQLELSLQRDYIHSLAVEHPELLTMFLSGQRAPRKVKSVIPHDLGSPAEDPWHELNAYTAQDVCRWKDLNPKFVLQIYRDYLLTGDREFLVEAWPAAWEAVENLKKYDRDGDGLIENEGYPDQTYDTWSACGPSAYSGGLWLACLNALGAMAEILGLADESQKYHELLKKAQKAYEDKLWNGEYYLYDTSTSGHHDSIMADQLAGQWFNHACGLPDILPVEHVRSALKKVFDYNVRRFFDGQRGAVNGMRPDGRLDKSNLQSQEMWIGTTFSLAAEMLQEGLRQEAFSTAEGIYRAIYQDFGLFFQTPEAINADGVYRATGYMRPLAVWAMQWALDRQLVRAT
jgi:non-lysosomal glucosylceramidase